ncbi:MAG TPA: hypothetical protein VL400_17195 [Polyangiaceae bacterium]|nr:hypothetical protein [Polyangiaceae bacterium]
MIAAAVGAASCSLAFDLSRNQCESPDDCKSLGVDDAQCVDNVCVPNTTSSGGGGAGGGVDPAWACLDGFTPPVVTAPDKIAYPFRFEYAIQPGVVPPGLSISLCSSLDVDCTSPVPGTPQPDADGKVTLELDPAFDGYIEIGSDDCMPSLAYLHAPVILPMKEVLIRMITPSQFQGLVNAAQQTYDDTRGVAVILTSNCQDDRTPGVAVTTQDTDAQSVAFYFRGNYPDIQATSTDKEGAAGYLNLPLGIITVDASIAETSQFIGESSFRSKAGRITYVPIGPTLPP